MTKATGKAAEKRTRKDGKEEEKKEAPVELIRKSSRNEGKVANYNIDDLLDAADKELNGSTGG